MKEENLGDTKPIKTLDSIENEAPRTRAEMYEQVVTEKREDRYREALEDKLNKDMQEEAEKALAVKNIEMAETLLEEENVEVLEETPVTEEVEEKKESFMDKIKNKWNGFSKGQKIGLIAVLVLVLLLIVLTIVFISIKSGKKSENVNGQGDNQEVAAIMKSNYYYKDGTLYFLNDKDEEIGSYACTNKDENYCYVAINAYRDNFDVPRLETTNGEEKEQVVPIYGDNYVFVVDSKLKGDNKPITLYSIKEEKTVGTYYDVKAYNDDLVVIKDENSKYGLIKMEAAVKTVIKPTYSYLGMIDGQKNLIAKTAKGYVVIDQKNKTLSKPLSGAYEIKYYNETFIVAVVSGSYNAYDYKGNLVTGGYAFISVSSNYAALIDNQRVYVIDDTGLKYNEDGVELKTDDYVKTYIYNENDELERVKNSFAIDGTGDDVSVVVYDEDGNDEYYNLDKVTAQVNKKYDYMNYFDGKLYFYKDKLKKELIGSYTCNNENTLNNIKEDYTTCVPAMDTIFESNDMMEVGAENRKTMAPLINNQFVFITDGANMIYLYDLVKKAPVVPYAYTSINTYLDDNGGKFTSYNGTVSVIAISRKSGLYGMFTIKGNSVTSVYAFEYNKMERLGNYVLAQGSDSKWHLLSSKDDIKTVFPGKVVGYSSDLKHFKILSGTTYGVYDINANMVSKTVYNYVELYTDFFAAVDSNHELNIYDYQGKEIVSEGITIGDYPYTNTNTPAFKISKSGNVYTVLVYNGTDYEEHILTAPENNG